jgi:hypothetical protein
MKGTCKVTRVVFTVILGSYVCIVPSRADNLHVSVGIILKFDSSGNESVFANSGLNTPWGLAFDGSGDLYVANAGNNTIEEFNLNGTGSVFATSRLDCPIGLAFDGSGNLFVANYGNNTIEEFNPNGTGSVFATTSSGVSNPYGLAFFGDDLYVGNAGNNTIEKFNSTGGRGLCLVLDKWSKGERATRLSLRQRWQSLRRKPWGRQYPEDRSRGRRFIVRLGIRRRAIPR